MVFSFILLGCLTVFCWRWYKRGISEVNEYSSQSTTKTSWLLLNPSHILARLCCPLIHYVDTVMYIWIPNFLDCAIAILKLSIFSLKVQSVFHILQKTPLACHQSVWGVACKKLNCICLSFPGCQKFYWFVYWNHVSQILGRSCLCWSNSKCQIGGLQQCRMGSHQFWWPRRRYKLWAKIISSHCFGFTGSQYRTSGSRHEK